MRLHALLVRVARFQLARRAPGQRFRGESVEDLATEAADDALVAILAHLGDFRGASRFVTWACKFAIVESSLALRKRALKEREIPLDPDGWRGMRHPIVAPAETREQLEVLRALGRAVDAVLTNRQREVFVAIALNGAPIDLVAERLGSTRGAVYKTLHDARRKLRAHVVELTGSAR